MSARYQVTLTRRCIVFEVADVVVEIDNDDCDLTRMSEREVAHHRAIDMVESGDVEWYVADSDATITSINPIKLMSSLLEEGP